MGLGTWAQDQHGHRINTGTGSTQAWKHKYRSNMGTGTWAWEQHGHRNMGTGLKHVAIIRQPGVGGRSPWQAETQCCRNGVSEAHVRAEGTGRKLVLYMKRAWF